MSLHNIDVDFGSIYSNSSRTNGERLWQFSYTINEQKVLIFLKGTDSGINEKCKSILKHFLDYYPYFLEKVKNLLNDCENSNLHTMYFKNDKFAIETISIIDEEYDVVMISSCENYLLNTLVHDLNIIDFYFEDISHKNK